VIKDFAGAEDHKPPARNSPKKLEQTTIAGTVDPRRSRNHDLYTGLTGGFAGDALTLEFGFLINVTRAKRRVFVSRRLLHVAVDANGTAVDDTPRATCFGGVDYRPHGLGVHRAVLIAAESRLTIDGADVVDDLHAFRCAPERIRVSQITANNLNVGKVCRGVGTRAPDEGADVITTGSERASEVTTCESGCAGD